MASPFQSQSLYPSPSHDVSLYNSVAPSNNHVQQQALPALNRFDQPQFSGLFSSRIPSKLSSDPFNAASFLDNNDFWSSSSMHSSGSPLPLDEFGVFSSAVAAAESIRGGISLSDTFSFDA